MFDNMFLFIRTVLFSFTNADWQGAQEKSGSLGMAGEFVESLLGTNTRPFCVDDKGGWQRGQIQSLLNSHGIEMWGWGHSMGQYFFRVKRRQGAWAQYVLLRQGVPLCGPLLPGSAANPSMAQQDGSSPDGTKEAFDPLSGIDKAIDRLASW